MIILLIALAWLLGLAALGWAMDAPRRARRREDRRVLRDALRDLQRGGQGVAKRTRKPQRSS